MKVPSTLVTFLAAVSISSAAVAMVAMLPRSKVPEHTTTVSLPNTEFDGRWMVNETSVLKKQDKLLPPPRPTPQQPPKLFEDIPTPQVERVSTVEDEPVVKRRKRVERKHRNVCERHGMRKVITRHGRSWRCRR